MPALPGPCIVVIGCAGIRGDDRDVEIRRRPWISHRRVSSAVWAEPHGWPIDISALILRPWRRAISMQRVLSSYAAFLLMLSRMRPDRTLSRPAASETRTHTRPRPVHRRTVRMRRTRAERPATSIVFGVTRRARHRTGDRREVDRFDTGIPALVQSPRWADPARGGMRRHTNRLALAHDPG
jgi:hypothetical protein